MAGWTRPAGRPAGHRSSVIDSCQAMSCSLDPAQFAANRLSPAEWKRFATQGFLIVKNAISEAAGNRLQQLLRDMHSQLRASGSYTAEQDIREAVFNRTNRLQEDPDVLALLTQADHISKSLRHNGIQYLLLAQLFSVHAPCASRYSATPRL